MMANDEPKIQLKRHGEFIKYNEHAQQERVTDY